MINETNSFINSLRKSGGRAQWGSANVIQCPPVNRVSAELQQLSKDPINDGNMSILLLNHCVS